MNQMRYKIYAKDGVTVRAEAETLEYNGTYMGERNLTVTVRSACPISFANGDYIDYRGERFTLRTVPSEKRQARSYTSGEAIVYEGLRFSGYYAELGDVQFCDLVEDDNELPYTGMGTFSFYVTGVEDFGGRVQANLDRAYGKGVWTVSYGEGAAINKDKSMSIGGDTSVHDALVQFSTDFDVNFIIKGRTIYIGKEQEEASRTYIYGKGNGLKSLTRTADANQRIVTKLRVYGSTKNLPYDYYNKVSGEVRSTVKGLLKGVRGGKTCYGLCPTLPKAYLDASAAFELPGGRGTFTGTWGAAEEGDTTTTGTEAEMTFNPSMQPPRDYNGRTYQQAVSTGATTLGRGTYLVNAGAVKPQVQVTSGNNNWEYTCKLQLWEAAEFNSFMLGLGGSAAADVAEVRVTEDEPDAAFESAQVEIEDDMSLPTLVAVIAVSGKVKVVSATVTSAVAVTFSRGGEPDGYFIHVCDGSDDAEYEGMYAWLKGGTGENGVLVTVTEGADKDNVPSGYLYYDRSDGRNYYTPNLMLPGYPEESLAAWAQRVSEEDTDTGRKVKELTEGGFTFSGDKSLPYIISPMQAEYGLREGEVIFDGSDEDWDEVNPSLEGMTTSELETTAGYGGSETYADGGELDRLISSTEIADNGVSATGGYGDGYRDTEGEMMKASFEITIPNIGFDIWEQRTADETPTLHMKSGMCAGREFEILSCVKADAEDISKGYRLTLERTLDEDANMYYPNSVFGLSAGDHYVIEGIKMPGVYVKAASVKVFFEGVEWLKANDHTAYTYQPEMDNIYLAAHPDYGAELVEGMKMPFTDAEMGITLQAVTISQLVIKEGDADIPQYEVTLDDEATAEMLTANLAGGSVGGGGGTGMPGMQGVKILKTGDTEAASDSNVFSALRSLSTFLRKDKSDSTRYLLSLFGGAVFGADGFAGGMSGFGAKIDDGGNGEMESLTVRRELTVPLLSYNRVDIKVGDKWRAPGGGVIAGVDTDARRCTLRLAEGEIGAVAVGDICMGIFHSEVSADNAAEDTDDGRGNRTFAGFTTVYFRITGVEGYRNEAFTYELRPVSERWTGQAEPFAEMQFVAYGSFTDEERQTSVYETRTYTRMLWKQNTWEIGVENIALQYGDLSNLGVFGLEMDGYSAYLNSVYFTGTLTQVKPDGTPVRTANDRGAWEAGHYDYYDRVSHDGRIWLCVAEDGTDSEPAKGNADWLLEVDKGADGKPGKDGEGVNANLLDDTEFASESRMSAWTEGSRPTGDYSDNGIHEGGPQGANYYRCGTWMTEDELQFKDIIQQTVGDRLSKGEWHTLSFWSRSDADWISVNETSAAYGFGLREVRLTAGHRYRFGGNGRVSAAAAAAGVKLVVMIYNADWSWSKEVSIMSQADSTVLSELDDVPSTGAYNIRAYASTGTDGETTEVTANSYILQDLDGVMSTYIYPGVVDSGAGGYIDGEWTDVMPSGQGVRWPLASGWARHTLTFKTLGSFDASTHVLFRLWPSPCHGTAVWADISRPKLETGQSATAYMPGGSDMDGREGQPGCVLRVSEWALGTVYRNDAELATDGVRYLDIAMMRNDASTTGWDAYQCLKTHTSTILNRPISTQGGTYWSKFGANVGAIFTSLIIAKNAKIRFLQGNSITVEKEDGTVTAGMQGSTSGDKTRFWAGSAVPDEAPFRVNEEGKMTAENAVITGYLYKSKTVLTRDNIDDFKIDADDMFTGQYLDLKKTGTWIEFSDLASEQGIYMPSIYPYDTSMTEEGKDYVRSLVGNTILLYNRSSYNVIVTANNKESEESSPVSFGIRPGWFASMECKASTCPGTVKPEVKDYEDIYWLYRLGKIR